MPPKRTAATPTASRSSKRVRISNATDVIGTQGSVESHASGRPKRSGPEPMYNFTRPKAPKSELTTSSPLPQTQPRGITATAEPVKRGRGRPKTSGPASVDPVKRGRGRPRTNAAPVEGPAKQGRGRPKVSQSRIKIASSTSQIPTEKKSPGRPPKALSRSLSAAKGPVTSSASKQTTAWQAVSKAKSKVTKLVHTTGQPGGKRGRPRKITETDHTDITEKTSEDELQADIEKPVKRGRKPKNLSSANKIEVAVPQVEESDFDDVDENEPFESLEDDQQYWLMKAEPETRLENGKDVSFSIDDLMNATEPEGWDGVRNAGARNNMRAMKLGDLAFFYQSNCKTPGIVGVMSIAREHSVDESAFDPEHPYYDVKSTRDNPKWDLVHVEFESKFKDIISKKELQQYAKPGGALENLQTLKQTRLSVSKVTPRQWNFIMSLAKEDDSLVDGEGQPPAILDGDDEDGDDNSEEKPTVDHSKKDLVDDWMKNSETAAVAGDGDDDGEGDRTGTDATGTDATGTDATGTDATGTDTTGTDTTGYDADADLVEERSSSVDIDVEPETVPPTI